MSWTLDGRPLRRVLVTRLRYLGDIAMSTVVLSVLRRGDRDLRLDYLCEAAHAPLLQGHPQLHRIQALDARRQGSDAVARAAPARRGGFSGWQLAQMDEPETGRRRDLPPCGTWAMLRRLRGARYDLAVDLFFNPRSAWLLRLAGIPLRVGGDVRGYRKHLYTHLAPSPSPEEMPWLFEAAGGGMGDHLSRLAPLRHDDGRPFLQWIRETLPQTRLGPMVPRPEPCEQLRQILAGLSSQGRRHVLLAPAATWPSKEWPVESWQRLIRGLLDQGHDVVVLCPPRGPGVYEALADALPAGRGGLLPPLPLAWALSAVGAAALLVGVDGGIAHAAVAMQIPTIALFGPTDPSVWFPYERLGPYRVLASRPPCHPCHRHSCADFTCMPDLTPERVLEAIPDVLAREC